GARDPLRRLDRAGVFTLASRRSRRSSAYRVRAGTGGVRRGGAATRPGVGCVQLARRRRGARSGRPRAALRGGFDRFRPKRGQLSPFAPALALGGGREGCLTSPRGDTSDCLAPVEGPPMRKFQGRNQVDSNWFA